MLRARMSLVIGFSFSVCLIIWATLWHWGRLSPNINDYHEYFWMDDSGRWGRPITSPPSVSGVIGKFWILDTLQQYRPSRLVNPTDVTFNFYSTEQPDEVQETIRRNKTHSPSEFAYDFMLVCCRACTLILKLEMVMFLQNVCWRSPDYTVLGLRRSNFSAKAMNASQIEETVPVFN
jgi:hypothetical protein